VISEIGIGSFPGKQQGTNYAWLEYIPACSNSTSMAECCGTRCTFLRGDDRSPFVRWRVEGLLWGLALLSVWSTSIEPRVGTSDSRLSVRFPRWESMVSALVLGSGVPLVDSVTDLPRGAELGTNSGRGTEDILRRCAGEFPL
jgi:hypothetical protein